MRGLLQQLLMRKALHLQERIAELQKELEQTKVEGSAGGGVVKVIASATGEILEVKISKELLKPEELELLEDLVLVAVRDAMAKAQEASTSKWQAMLSELGIPIDLLLGGPTR
ncbi:MAG: hypothetical protein HZRFUVUK_000962 [Candidatus Fervidibacterota bacterium]|jgi:DNA-binding YbaB/EbfC family protein